MFSCENISAMQNNDKSYKMQNDWKSIFFLQDINEIK